MRPDTNHSYLSRTVVHGWTEINGVWCCQVYPKDEKEFIDWMAKSCPNAECTWRFNNGSPFYQVYIGVESEAANFALKWV